MTMQPRLLLVILLALVSLPFDSAQADPSDLEMAIGVVVGPTGMDRTATVQPGDEFLVRVVTDALTSGPFDGIQTAQFGVVIDPRLEVVNRFASPDAFLASNPGPEEWRLGFLECVREDQNPYTFVTYVLRLPVSAGAATDLWIGLGPLPSIGEPMLYGSCLATSNLLRLNDAGGALLNPTAPSVIHLSGAPRVLVEGRPLSLAWETSGATTATLDGSPVSLNGGQTLFPTADTTFQLVASDGVASDSQDLDVEVIRTPRVDVFIAEQFESGGSTQVRLSWDVRGATVVEVDGQVQQSRGWGSKLVAFEAPLTWELTARNEWGTTTAVATLENVGDLPPVILSLTADPNPFDNGSDVNLSYSLFNATSASISPGVGAVDPVSGVVTVMPSASQTYTLTATNANGSVTRDVLVQMRPPVILSFVADPPTIFAGSSTTLRWTTRSGLDLSISPDVGFVPGPSGEVVVTPTADNTEYVLTASNPEASTTASVQIPWLLPSIGMGASTTEPFGGETFTLNVLIAGAESATLEPGFGSIDPVGGLFETSVSVTTTFTLTATNPKGTVTNQVTVTPRAPVVSLTASDLTPFGTNPIQLTATIEGAVSATLEPGFGPIDPAGGVFETVVGIPTTFVVAATNPVGTSFAQVTVTPKPPTATLTASKLDPFPTEPVILTATIEGASSATLEPGFGAIPPTGWSVQTTVTTTTTFTLTATSAAGVAVSEVTITPKAPVVSLEVSNFTPYATDPVTLTATVLGAESVTLEPGFGTIDPGGGTFEALVEQPTTFFLTAVNATGTSQAQVTVIPQAPLAELTAEPLTPFPDQPVVLTAVLAGAATASIEPGIGAIDPGGGFFQLTVTEPTTFVLAATNAAGSTNSEVTVTPRTPEITNFNADPPEIVGTESSMLHWSVGGADQITIEPGGFTTTEAFGSISVSPTVSTVYTLTATNLVGDATATATVDVVPFSIRRFIANPNVLVPGQRSTLAWEIVGNVTASIDGIGAVPPVGTLQVTPFETTEYILRATDGFEERTATVSVTVLFEVSGDLLLSWSPDSYPGIPPFVEVLQPFEFFALARGTTGFVQGFEFSLNVPACVVVLNRTITADPSGIDVGQGPDNWIVGLSQCRTEPIVALLRYETLILDPQCVGSEIEANAASPSSFDPPVAGYLACNGLPLPLVVVNSLTIPGVPVPAVSIQLTGRTNSSGIELTWEIPAVSSIRSLTILRGAPGESLAPEITFTEGEARAEGRWIDREAEPGRTYRYQVSIQTALARIDSEEIEVAREGAATPGRTELLANVPNPFNPRTSLRFALGEPSDVSIRIFDIAGRQIRELRRAGLPAGIHAMEWNGLDGDGRQVASGTYLVRLQAGRKVDQRRVTLLK